MGKANLLKECVDNKNILVNGIEKSVSFGAGIGSGCGHEWILTLSHEIRTSLTLILSTIQITEQNKKLIDGEYRKIKEKHLNIIKRNCLSLLKMVNNIIDVNRIESGVFKVNERNCDIVRIIRDITSSADVYAGMKKIKLSFNSNKDNCIIACDPFLLERILLNLLSNSIKFTPVGGIIAINLNIMSEKVAITVTDSGRGIPVKYQNSIFDCFSQTDGECIIEKKGSGLGLYLVKKLIEKMGGEIRLVSKEGEGSTFTFYLPAKKQPNPRVEKTGNMIVHERNELLQIEFSDIHEV